MEDKIKIEEVNSENKEIVFDTQEFFNQNFINDLTKIIKTNSAVPSYIPKKFIDCFYLYFDGATTYELYVYINNSWKKCVLG